MDIAVEHEVKFHQLEPDVVVVLLDLAMPDIDGIKAAKRMATCDPTVPIVLFTVFESEGIKSAAQQAGIRAVVSKTEAWNLLVNIENVSGQESSARPH